MQRLLKIGIVLVVAISVFVWYRNRPLPGAPTEHALLLPASGVRLTLKESGEAPVPGSGQRVRVSLGELESDRGPLTLLHADGRVIVATRTIEKDDEIAFMLGGREHVLTIKGFYRADTGQDSAVLHFRVGRSERARIDALLLAMEESGMTFIRNGTDYGGAEAASHLRRKLRAAGERVQTAEQFVEHLGSRSSMSGRAYQVRTKDGVTVDAGEWMRAQLANAPATSR